MSAEATYFILDAINVASEYTWKDCIFSSAAITTTGAATIHQNFINCCNETANEVRALSYGDIDATGVVVIVGGNATSPTTLTVGQANQGAQYTTLLAAVTAANAGDVIYLEPGTHTIATDTTLVLNKSISIVGKGRCTVTGDVNDRMIMINKPTTGTSTTYVELTNIHFVNTDAGNGDVIEVDNDGGGTGDLLIKTIDCSFDSNGGLSWDIDQTTATEDLDVYIKGNMAVDMVIDGMNIDMTQAGDSCTIDGYNFGASVLVFGTTNVANIINLINCQYESEAMATGGSASLILNLQGCSRVSAGALVAPVIEDFDATAASENIQIGTLDT